MRRSRAAVLGTLLVATAACGPADRTTPDRVVVLVLDALHAEHLGSYGGPEGLTPNLDRVASEGVRFSRSFSNNTWTLPSTTSLFTGRSQESHGVVARHFSVEEHELLLPELFAEAGWQTAAFTQMLFAS